ncbi:alanine dehydrogenase [Thiomicrorhabdus sp. ZW0627]|uniref:alanine dehydrogenase n=1 Tax=Thiomicrorhabdus sp. ZW0627 TaxID=3039774 RepID=UPI0024362D83|nr:alanine dehydrogenase [Thiomicrorhabdus sp. ZW0627]MDG6773256.1 alanine dehydrogenase [Thiomicrorhabdus sp. ZW0627]
MKVGVPKEIKNNEFRVGMTPGNVRELINHGHQVLVETEAAAGIGFSDDDYLQVGAQIANTPAEIFEKSDMIVKVKEPQPNERAILREGQILFTYLHLAPDREQTQELIKSKAVCIAYETVKDRHGGLPLLAPMSEVAGRMSMQVGAHFLQKMYGGRGVLLAGVTGVETAKVVVIGGGTVGRNAVQVAVGLGAETVVLDRNLDALRTIEMQFGNSVKTIYSTAESLEKHVLEADVVVGAVLVPGASAPKLVTVEHIKKMKNGSVIVDVAIDQGGCMETSRPTSHENPTYIVDGVVHYCVTNMPGAVPTTSTFALNNATLPYILDLANKGYKQALLKDDLFREGLNIYKGHVTCRSVAEALGLDYLDAKTALQNE